MSDMTYEETIADTEWQIENIDRLLAEQQKSGKGQSAGLISRQGHLRTTLSCTRTVAALEKMAQSYNIRMVHQSWAEAYALSRGIGGTFYGPTLPAAVEAALEKK